MKSVRVRNIIKPLVHDLKTAINKSIIRKNIIQLAKRIIILIVLHFGFNKKSSFDVGLDDRIRFPNLFILPPILSSFIFFLKLKRNLNISIKNQNYTYVE